MGINEPTITGREEVETVDKLTEDEHSFFKEFNKISISDIGKLEDPRVLPSCSNEELDSSLDNVDVPLLKKQSNETIATYHMNSNVKEFLVDRDVGKRTLTNTLTNKPNFDGKDLTLKELKLKRQAKSEKTALMRLASMTGMGAVIHVPLWHSGFWVTINPLTNEEIINLEFELVNELTRIGKITNTLIFSNYSVIFAKVIFKYFKLKITDTTIRLTEDDDIANYIATNDLQTIALALATTMYPKGFSAVVPCKHSIILGKDKIPTCDFKARLKIDLGELLYVDTSLLNIDQLTQMSKKTPAGVTVDEVLSYQESLENSGTLTTTYKQEDDLEFSITLKVPSIQKYINNGEVIINELRNKSNDIVRNSDQVNDPAKAEEILIKSLYLQLYNHYIDNLKVDDEEITELAGVNQALDILGTNQELNRKIINDITSYIDNSLIAIVGVPNFSCPTCKTVQSESELIPINVFEYAFSLLHSKYQKIIARMERQNKK